MAKLFVDGGIVVLVAFISPYRRDRERVRELVEEGEFIEIYVKCPLEVCEERDPKGMYRKAREGKVKDFTGISAPYEEPLSPEITLESDKLSVEESAQKVINYLQERGLIPGD